MIRQFGRHVVLPNVQHEREGLSDATIRHIPSEWEVHPSTLSGAWQVINPGYKYRFILGPVPYDVPNWLRPLASSAARLLDLGENWDSYGAPAIEPENLLFGLDLLLSILPPHTPAPSVVPTSTGSVQFEWHTQGVDLEIEVISPGKVNLYYENEASGTLLEETLASDFSSLVSLVHDLQPSSP